MQLTIRFYGRPGDSLRNYSSNGRPNCQVCAEVVALRIVAVVSLLLAMWSAGSARSAEHAVDCAPGGIAVGGFDLVSYHQDGGPIPGTEKFSTESGGLIYRFANAENLARFRQSPAEFLPVYRGYCAATLAMGRLACPDYTNFKIEDGRLLLFEVTGFTNGRTLWNSDPADFRRRADSNFPRLVD